MISLATQKLMHINLAIMYTVSSRFPNTMSVVSPLSNRLSQILNLAIETASSGTCHNRHGAVLFTHTGHQVLSTGCNSMGNRCHGYDVPTCHAEAQALKPLADMNRRFGAFRRGQQLWYEKVV